MKKEKNIIDEEQKKIMNNINALYEEMAAIKKYQFNCQSNCKENNESEFENFFLKNPVPDDLITSKTYSNLSKQYDIYLFLNSLKKFEIKKNK